MSDRARLPRWTTPRTANCDGGALMGRPKVVLPGPLPRRVRLRLAVTSARDHAATWLAVHVNWRAGMWLWKLTGGWR